MEHALGVSSWKVAAMTLSHLSFSVCWSSGNVTTSAWFRGVTKVGMESNKTTDWFTICAPRFVEECSLVETGFCLTPSLPYAPLCCYLMLLFFSKPRTFLFGRYFILRRSARCQKISNWLGQTMSWSWVSHTFSSSYDWFLQISPIYSLFSTSL